MTKSDIPGHSLLQLEGAGAEALGDADVTTSQGSSVP